MPRLELELTSSRDDGSWTWRAAGAREPRGTLAGDLLYAGAQVGDLVRVEADIDIDGITVTSVLPPKQKRSEPDRLEIVGSGRDEPDVITNLVSKPPRDKSARKGGRDGRRPGGPSRDGDTGGERGRGERTGSERSGDGQRSGGGDRSRPRKPAPPTESRPKPKRLRARREHRDAAMATLPEEQKAVAEQVLRGGLPAVRKAIDEQNVQLQKENRPTIKPDSIVVLAEELLPRLREAEWLDRADAALSGVDELDLRDLRSVVTGADTAARSAEARQLAETLREAVTKRVEQTHAAWLAELAEALRDERTVRALRMSSRPPKAGSPLPPDLAQKLAEAAGAALTTETGSERYALVVDALAFSPVREQATPLGVPEKPSDELVATIRKLSSRVPQVAARFGITPEAAPAKRPVPPPPATTPPTAGAPSTPPAARPIPPPPTPPQSATPPPSPQVSPASPPSAQQPAPSAS
jgi:hypothetical protein